MGKTYSVAAKQVAAKQVVQQAIIVPMQQVAKITTLRATRIAAVQRCYTARKIAAKQQQLAAAQQVAAAQVLQASKQNAYNLAMLQLNAATQLAAQQLQATYGIAPVQQVAATQPVAKKQPSVAGKQYTIQGIATKGNFLWLLYNNMQMLQKSKITKAQAIAAAQVALQQHLGTQYISAAKQLGSITAAYYQYCSSAMHATAMQHAAAQQ